MTISDTTLMIIMFVSALLALFYLSFLVLQKEDNLNKKYINKKYIAGGSLALSLYLPSLIFPLKRDVGVDFGYILNCFVDNVHIIFTTLCFLLNIVWLNKEHKKELQRLDKYDINENKK